MTFQIVTISPKGQITIPVSERKKFKTKKYGMKVIGYTIVLRPIEIKLMDDGLQSFEALGEKSFDFWKDDSEDVYQV